MTTKKLTPEQVENRRKMAEWLEKVGSKPKKILGQGTTVVLGGSSGATQAPSPSSMSQEEVISRLSRPSDGDQPDGSYLLDDSGPADLLMEQLHQEIAQARAQASPIRRAAPAQTESEDWGTRTLASLGLARTRAGYLGVTYPFGRPTPWTAEHESMLPEDLQDWSLVGEE